MVFAGTRIHDLQNPRFLRSNLGKNAWESLGVDKEGFYLKIPETIEQGPSGNASLCKVHLCDRSDTEVATLFVKIQHPARGEFGSKLEELVRLHTSSYRKKRVNEHLDRFRKYAANQANNLNFWNTLGIPAPQYLGRYHSEKGDVMALVENVEFAEHILEKTRKEQLPIEMLFMTYVPGNTVDEDLMGLKLRIEANLKKITDEPFMNSAMTEKLQSENNFFEEKMKELVISGLYTTNDLSIRGTYALYYTPLGKKIMRNIRQADLNLIASRLGESTQLAKLWDKWRQSGRIPEEARKAAIAEYHSKGFKDSVKVASTNFRGIVGSLADADLVYQQGDEHFHHQKLARDQKLTMGELRTVILDSDRVMMGACEWYTGKIVGSPLVYSDYERAKRFLEISGKQREEIVKKMREEGKLESMPHYKSWTRESQERSGYGLMAENMLLMRMRIRSFLDENLARNHDRWVEEQWVHNNPLLGLPPEKMPLTGRNEAYRLGPSIESIRKNLRNYLEGMKRDTEVYTVSQIIVVEGVQKYLESEGII